MPAGRRDRVRPLRPLERRLQRLVWGDGAGEVDARVRTQRRLVVRGVVAIAFASGLLSTLHVFATPPFAPPDETSHIAYALAITDAYRPFVDEFPDPTRLPYWREGLSVWTANHPHLYNVVAGVPLRVGEATGYGLEGIWGARLVSAGSLAAGVLLVGWLVVLLVPGRPELAVATPGIAGLFPHFVHVSGIAYNDAFAFLTTTATLVAATVVLRRGPTLRRVAVLAAAASAAAGTRISGLLPLALAGLVVGVAPLLRGSGSRAARLRTGVAHGLLVAVVAASTVGWVYVQNLARYGGVTATQTLLDMFNREPRGLMWLRLVRRDMWEHVHRQWWSHMDSSSHLPDVLLVPFRWWALAAGAGLLVVALRRLVTGSWRPTHAALLAPWILLAALFGGTVLTFGQFVARGGSPHGRYFFPVVAIIGLAAATGLLELPGRRRGLPAAACTLSLLVANLVVLYGYASYPDLYGPILAVRRWVMLGEAPLVPAAVVTVLLLAGAFAVHARSLWRLAAAGVRPPPPRHARPLARRDPAAAVLVALTGALAGAWLAYWFADWLPWLLGGAAGMLAALAAAVLADRRLRSRDDREEAVPPAGRSTTPAGSPGGAGGGGTGAA